MAGAISAGSSVETESGGHELSQKAQSTSIRSGAGCSGAFEKRIARMDDRSEDANRFSFKRAHGVVANEASPKES